MRSRSRRQPAPNARTDSNEPRSRGSVLTRTEVPGLAAVMALTALSASCMNPTYTADEAQTINRLTLWVFGLNHRQP